MFFRPPLSASAAAAPPFLFTVRIFYCYCRCCELVKLFNNPIIRLVRVLGLASFIHKLLNFVIDDETRISIGRCAVHSALCMLTYAVRSGGPLVFYVQMHAIHAIMPRKCSFR